MREAMLAGGLVVLAVVTLGTDWRGVEIGPGEWRDRVTPLQWAWMLAATTLLGAVGGTLVRAWPRRIVIVVPVLVWLLWQLREGTLWPIAVALYGSALVVAWVVGVTVGGWLRVRRSTARP